MARFAKELLNDLIRDPTSPNRVVDLAKELLDTYSELREALENYESAKEHYKTQVFENLEMMDARDKRLAYWEKSRADRLDASLRRVIACQINNDCHCPDCVESRAAHDEARKLLDKERI